MAKNYTKLADDTLQESETATNTVTVIYNLKELRAKKQAIKEQIDSYQREKIAIDALIAKCLELNIVESV